MLDKLYVKFKSVGLTGVARRIYQRLFVSNHLRYLNRCKTLLSGKAGIEIGGPSAIFKASGFIPLYPIAGRIDNCNFGAVTVWEGTIDAGNTFKFAEGKRPGRQYVAEATDLPVASESYDFVLSSHCVEHMANPLRGLEEWIRVLKPEGLLILVVPHKDGTFDHRRPVTRYEHLLEDFQCGLAENDLTHFDEIMLLHDLSLDPGAGTREQFEARSRKNHENRCFHQHVFDTRLSIEMVDSRGLQILAVELALPYHIAIVAKKLRAGAQAHNERFTRCGRKPIWASPFPSDQ